jgi:Na+-transporting methylmalonyl-CoA/oxaloacetate decarboxylase gamma subunit
MKNKTKVVLIFLFLLVFFMVIRSEGQKAKWEGTIEEKDGVKKGI